MTDRPLTLKVEGTPEPGYLEWVLLVEPGPGDYYLSRACALYHNKSIVWQGNEDGMWSAKAILGARLRVREVDHPDTGWPDAIAVPLPGKPLIEESQ